MPEFFYEMLTGRRPFELPSQAELIASILHECQTPLSELRPEIPEELATVVELARRTSSSFWDISCRLPQRGRKLTLCRRDRRRGEHERRNPRYVSHCCTWRVGRA